MSNYLFQTGNIIDGKFKVLAPLGWGAFSQVYKIEDLVLDRAVFVLKLLLPLDPETSPIDKLRDEYKIYERLGPHRHIAKLFEASKLVEKDIFYLKLEYIPGETVAARLKSGKEQRLVPPLPLQETYAAIVDLLDALHFMHDRPEPVLHRDIKPSNLILSQSQGLVVIDFNVSKALIAGKKSISQVGTPPYMAPEVYLGDADWDVTCDLYSVGVLLHAMITGEDDPFPRHNRYSPGAVPTTPKQFVPDLPDGVVDIVFKALAYNRADRYQSALEMKADVEKLLANPVAAVTGNDEVDPMNDDYQNPISKTGRPVEMRRYLQEAREANDAGRYPQADELLAKAKRLADGETTLLAEYENAASAINAQRAQEASRISQQIRGLFAAAPLDESHLAQLLEQLAQLDKERAAAFQRQLADRLESQQGQQVFLETKSQCEALWQRAEALVAENTPYPIILAETYDKAVRIVEQAVAVSDLPELKGLLRTVQEEQRQARKRFEVLSTAAEVGAYKEMIDILDREKDEHKTIQLTGPGGEHLGTMSVQEAKAQAVQMAEEFAHRKAIGGYWEAAKVHIAAHAPGAAMAELEKSEQLYMLNDEDKRRLANYRSKIVEPELARFKAAQDLLERARNKIDPVDGWRLIDEAAEQYEWLPGLDAARAHLLPRLQIHIEQMIETVRQTLRLSQENGHPTQFDKKTVAKAANEAQTAVTLAESIINYIERAAGNISLTQQSARDAQQKAEEAKALAQRVNQAVAPEEHVKAEAQANIAETRAQMAKAAAERAAALGQRRQPLTQLRQQAQTLLQQAQAQQTLIGELDTAVQELRQLLKTDIGAAGNRWQALKEQYDQSIIEAYGPLNRLARDLDIRLNVAGLLARLEQDFAANDYERITQAITDCDQAAQRQENLGQAGQLAQMREKLESRRAFLAGQANAQAGDAEGALAQLKKVTSGPDVEKARQLTADIQRELKKDKEIRRALNKAKSFLKNNPRRAYRALQPYENTLSRHHDEVIEKLSEAREKWEARVLAEIKAGLDEPLNDAKVAALRGLEKELRTELGVTGNLSAKRALAYCFAYEAEKAAALKEYDQAIESWDKAIGLDKQVAYVNGRIAAQKQQAEHLVREAPEAAEQIIRELQKEIYGDPDLHYWAARLYLQQAQQTNISPRSADELYSKAAAEIATALEQTENQSGVKKAAFKGKLEKLQKAAMTGQEVEREKEQIERQLTPSRTVGAFHDARKQAETLLKNHPQYPRPEMPALKRWWQDLRQTVINELETEASRIPADQLWKRFEPLGKILALDENHGEAAAMLNQMGSLIRQLERDVEQFNRDSDGLSVNASFDAEVLTKQIEYLQELQRRADAVYATLLNFSNHPVLSQQSGTALSTLNKLSADLKTTQERFDRFNALKNQADSLLTMSRASGDWSAFDQLLGKIADDGFAGHRTTNALRRRRSQDQERRRELKKWADDLDTYARQGNFIAALTLADRFQSLEIGDKDDIFGVQGRIEYHDPVTNQIRCGLRRIRPLLEEKARQLAQIGGWLLHSGLSELSQEHNLINNTAQLADAPAIIQWETEKQKIIAHKKRGDFKKAIKRCHEINDGTPLPGTLSLTGAIHRLSGPPVSLQQAQSDLARALLTQAEQKRETLKSDQQDVNETIAWLKQQERDWEDSWDAFTSANWQLRQAQTSRNPFGKAARIQSAQEKRDTALYECTRICPQHPDLDGVQRTNNNA